MDGKSAAVVVLVVDRADGPLLLLINEILIDVWFMNIPPCQPWLSRFVNADVNVDVRVHCQDLFIFVAGAYQIAISPKNRCY